MMMPDAIAVAAALRDGNALLTLPAGPDGMASADAAEALLADEPVAFVRIGNKLRAPLSLERLLFQFARGDDTGRADDEAARLWRALQHAAAGKERLVLVVTEADTLAPPALAFLRRLTTLHHPDVPPVQVVLVGATVLEAMPARVFEVPVQLPASARPPRRRMTAMAMAVALAGVVAAAWLAWSGQPPPPQTLTQTTQTTQTTTPTIAPAPAVASAAPAVEARAPEPAPSVEIAPAIVPPTVPLLAPPDAPPAASAPEDPAVARARLYREFTAFLDARGTGHSLSRAQRDTLFAEYLRRRQASPASPPPPAEADVPAGDGLREAHVVFVVPANAPGVQAQAERDAERLRPRVADASIRSAPDGPAATPGNPVVRFFHASDRAGALSLARELAAGADNWQLEDMSAQPARPAPGTMEVWLAR